MKQSNETIGRTTTIDVTSISNVPAKIDTGADSSSIWASDITLEEGQLSFCLFDKNSPYYNGKKIIKQPGQYSTIKVVSSSGERQIRYVVILNAKVKGGNFKIRFTLSDRSTMLYPVLLGQHFLDNHFVVNTTQNLPYSIQVQLNQAKSKRIKAMKQAESLL